MTEIERGILYLVATPIGNLADFSFRAVEILKRVDLIACEDTRHSRLLLDHYGIDRPLVAFHEHNEETATPQLLERLRQGQAVALIADAGTPLVNDPGFPLVRSARAAGIRVTPIPGPCALIAALSASGLPTHRFAFEGFPPRRSAARRARFEALRDEPRTLIFYEASHRIMDTLQDLAAIFPPERPIVIARELTKRFETITASTVGEAGALLERQPEQRRGEFVLVLGGAPEASPGDGLCPDQERVLRLLLEECSLRTAVALTARITGASREAAYRTALRWCGQGGAG